MVTSTAHSLPKAVQLSEMLIREIMAGRLQDGTRLPPERDMAARNGVAVGTLRKALARLQEQGLLERVQGSGNYIRARSDVESVYAFFRLERLEGGGLPSAKVLEVLRLRKPADAPNFGASKMAHRIRRVRFLDDEPVALEEIWLDQRFARALKVRDLMESLYHYYKLKLGLVIARVEDRLGISPVPDWATPESDLLPGTPAGHVERTSWGQDNLPAEYSRTWFNAARARYVSRLK